MAPDIQENILFWEERNHMQPIAEGNLRHIVRCIDWDKQRCFSSNLVGDNRRDQG